MTDDSDVGDVEIKFWRGTRAYTAMEHAAWQTPILPTATRLPPPSSVYFSFTLILLQFNAWKYLLLFCKEFSLAK